MPLSPSTASRNQDLPAYAYTAPSTSKSISFIMALTYPKKYENDINPDTWDRAIIDFANAEQQDLNGFLLHRMAHYKDSEYDDTMLWYCMKEDFVGWTKETWVPVNKDIVR